MKKYLVHLLILTLLLAVVTLIMHVASPEQFVVMVPISVAYFSVVYGVSHSVILNSMQKDPRQFIKGFLGISVGTMFLHVIVVFLYAITHLRAANTKWFLLCFGALFLIYLIFETVELLLYVHQQKKLAAEGEQDEPEKESVTD